MRLSEFLITIVIGVVVGFLLCVSSHKDRVVELTKTDTVFVYDTISFGRDELSGATQETKPATIKYIYVPEVQIQREIIHDTTYIVLPRQTYFTEAGGVSIWHSGIESTIDSLNVLRQTEIIKESIRPAYKKNTITAGIGADYATTLCFPVELRYTRSINNWFAVYTYMEYELINRQFGVGVGGQFKVSW